MKHTRNRLLALALALTMTLSTLATGALAVQQTDQAGLVTPSGMVTDWRFSQWAKALSPMVVTPFLITALRTSRSDHGGA